jgi:antitoxin component of MazEF toxin-antitoxin module
VPTRIVSILGKTWFYSMVKTISKIGNSEGLIFDAVLLHMAHLQAGDPVNVVVHGGGTITLTPPP